jgi:cleavage stimulation factor subunit 2
MQEQYQLHISNSTQPQAAPAGYQNSSMSSNGISGAPAQNGSSLPPLPAGVELPPGLSCPDAISRTLNILPPSQLLDVLSQMKQLVATDTPKAIELLRKAPQLSYAIFQALLLMGLVSTDALASVVEQHAAAAPIPAPPTVQVPTPQQLPQYQPPPSIPVHGQYPTGYPPPPPHLGGQISTPPVHGLAYPPPPPQQYQPPPAAAQQPDTEALMQQVIAMPQSLIDQLPPAERAQLLALRASFGAQAR